MKLLFHSTLYNGCNHLSMLGVRLIHVSKRGPWWCKYWHQLTASLLVQVMAYFLMAPSQWHHAIIWSNDDMWFMRSSGIHLRAIHWKMGNICQWNGLENYTSSHVSWGIMTINSLKTGDEFVCVKPASNDFAYFSQLFPKFNVIRCATSL